MRQEFNILVNKLNTDPLTAVSIFDNDTFTQILKPTYGTDLKQQFGSIKEYFEKLNREGKRNLTVQEYRKNGTSKEKQGNAFPVTFSETPQTSPQMQNNNTVGLNGNFGLGFSDIMNLNTNSVLKERLEVENDFLKKENKRLEESNKALERKILENEFSDTKASGNKELLKEAVNTFGPVLQMLMQNNSSSALNAPASQNLTPEKQQFITLISNPNFSNENVIFLYEVINAINTKEDFYDQLEALLK
ncbi:hypothetical protein [Flavobacterium sp. J27]|uniref:hypothetical protein n=1 Tax=Flavobacterium sp. J27 TaxID=2060419 RepID=UPI0010320ABC|nr:hypothetical protein [Flavobacterium sp. J27]